MVTVKTMTPEDMAETATKDYENIEGMSEANTIGFKFQVVDWVVFSLMLVVSVAIGLISAVRNRRKVSTQEFLLGGRNMPPLAVAISLLGGIISAISILGNPTEVYFYGTQIATSLLGAVPATIVINQIVVPVLYNLKLISLNEYMERRFKSTALRKMGTLVSLLSLAIYMGMCLYAPSLALATVTNLSTFASMVIMGAIVTFYITIGGVKAVVYTDVLQTLVMFGGVLVVVVLCCIDLGGVGEVWALAKLGGRLEFFNMDTSPYSRHTFWSTFTMGFFLIVNAIGLNQTTYQRFASVRTVEISKRLSWFFLLGFWVLWCLFFFSGLVAFAVYRDCDPLTSGKISKQDQIIPFLVTDKLGSIPGLSGLFVASVYGGVLSTLSSTGNSGACMVWEDFLKPLPYFSRLSDTSATRVVKILSSFTGVVAVALGSFMGNLGNILHVILSITSAITAPLCGVFLGGILLPWIEYKGAFTGFLVSFGYNTWIVVGKFMKGGGKPVKLPLSVVGCEGSLNATLETLMSTTLDSTFLNSAITTTASPIYEEANTKDIYDTSYCYYSLIGVFLTMVIAGVVSLFIGPTRPMDLEDGVVNATCGRLYKRVWHACSKTKSVLRTDGKEMRQDDDADLPMVSQLKSDLHSPQ